MGLLNGLQSSFIYLPDRQVMFKWPFKFLGSMEPEY